MGFITADDTMVARLSGILRPVEVRDPTGKVLGPYTPAVPPGLLERYQRNALLFDLEEAERISATEPPGCTTEEVLRHLRSLEAKE
jgi:hypothetical protein